MLAIDERVRSGGSFGSLSIREGKFFILTFVSILSGWWIVVKGPQAQREGVGEGDPGDPIPSRGIPFILAPPTFGFLPLALLASEK